MLAKLRYRGKTNLAVGQRPLREITLSLVTRDR